MRGGEIGKELVPVGSNSIITYENRFKVPSIETAIPKNERFCYRLTVQNISMKHFLLTITFS